jgi:hypothetical protein
VGYLIPTSPRYHVPLSLYVCLGNQVFGLCAQLEAVSLNEEWRCSCPRNFISAQACQLNITLFSPLTRRASTSPYHDDYLCHLTRYYRLYSSDDASDVMLRHFAWKPW